jgi:hypothetical protein
MKGSSMNNPAKIVELSLNEIDHVSGGDGLGFGAAVVGIGVAAFQIGYQIGRDIGKAIFKNK